MKKALFVCIHNSARSQMTEAFLNALGQELFEAESAGLEPGTLNPLAPRECPNWLLVLETASRFA